jgi:hypothetical protein
MGKTLTYSGFAISTLLIILAFTTAKTYAQLSLAVLLYPLLVYFALKTFPRRNRQAPAITIQLPKRSVPKAEEIPTERVVADIDKRTFIKLIGTAGISFFLFSLLGRRVENLLFGGALESQTLQGSTTPNNQLAQSSQPFEGYKISEIDDGIISYYGFINKDGAWLIMSEDTQTSSFRYAKGSSNFSLNWRERQSLKYDYYYNLF